MIELNVPRGVRGVMTTREGGISKGMYASLNLGSHVNDDPARVEHNRARLQHQLGVQLAWMNQVHGTDCVYRTGVSMVPTADAQWTDQPEIALCVGVADCLPVALFKTDGSAVAVAHAGWRGLAAGVLENTAEPMGGSIRAIMGPCIGAMQFQVGEEVRQAFVDLDPDNAEFFRADQSSKFLADLRGLARRKLDALGIEVVQDINECTVTQADRWFSYRREAPGGRMAMVVWLG